MEPGSIHGGGRGHLGQWWAPGPGVIRQFLFMMRFLQKTPERLARILYWIAGASIVSMMLLTSFDIILRSGQTLYRQYHWAVLSSVGPIPGTYELVSLLAALAVAFAVAHTSVEQGHVAMSLITRPFPVKIRAGIDTVITLLGFAFFALLSWQSFLYGNGLRETGEVSPTLHLPLFPVVYGVGLAAAAVCLVLLKDLSKHLAAVFEK
jgi:TRAP-type C4-dicarboxylate transport system permease small subunit